MSKKNKKPYVLDNLRTNIDYKVCGITRDEADMLFASDLVYDLDEILASKKNWCAMYQHCVWFMMLGISDEELRYRCVTIVRSSVDYFKPMTIPVLKLAVNLIMLYPFVTLDLPRDVTNDLILTEPYGFSQSYIKKYVNEVICDVDDISKAEKSYVMDEMFFHISRISFTFDDIVGIGISVRTFYDIDKQSNGKLNEILHDKIDPNLQPKEIESSIAEHVNGIVDVIKNTESDIVTMIESDNLMSKSQFGEVMVAVGFKADLDGKTIAVPAMNNFLLTGIDNAIDKYIDSVGGRKAGINGKIGMSVPGANAKKELAAAADFVLRKPSDMCNSRVTLPVEIKDERYLSGMNSHYYYDDDDGGKMKILNQSDTHLIGKMLRFRTPITCNCGTTICRYCYPKKLADANENVTSIGAYAATVLSEPLGQMVLSTKHYNGTNSRFIEFGEDFDRDFELKMADIYLGNVESDAMYIQINDIYKDNADDDSIEFACLGFDVLDKDKNLLYTVTDKNGARLFLINELDTLIKAKKDRTNLLVDINTLDEDCSLFMVEVDSSQTMDAAKKIKKLTCSKEKCGCVTYKQLFDALVDAYLTAGIVINFAHIELLVKSMMRKSSDKFSLPDFGPDGDPMDYALLSLNDALYNSLSPFTALRTGQLKKQLTDPNLYSIKKIRPSHQDVLFAEVPYDVIPESYRG